MRRMFYMASSGFLAQSLVTYTKQAATQWAQSIQSKWQSRFCAFPRTKQNGCESDLCKSI